MLGYTDENIARNIYKIIGTKIRFKTEEEEEDIVPFEWLGIVEDYNGVDIKQTDIYIKMNCAGYINRLLKRLMAGILNHLIPRNLNQVLIQVLIQFLIQVLIQVLHQVLHHPCSKTA
jgi:hypothetical protein